MSCCTKVPIMQLECKNYVIEDIDIDHSRSCFQIIKQTYCPVTGPSCSSPPQRFSAVLQCPTLPSVQILVGVAQPTDKSGVQSSIQTIMTSSVVGLDCIRVFSAGLVIATALAAMWEEKIAMSPQPSFRSSSQSEPSPSSPDSCRSVSP